jgi:Calcineurin-like phosphoesterase
MLSCDWSNSESFFDQDKTTRVLAPLRSEFGRYDVFGLAVGTYEFNGPLTSFCEHCAYSSGHRGLFLIPDLPRPNETLEIFDPLPVARTIATRPDLWPGVLFWTKRGVSAFAPLPEAYGLYQDILDSFSASNSDVDHILSEFNSNQGEPESKRLLQLSDLHFGTQYALRNQAYLTLHLRTKLGSIDRVVITGDLFDNPKEADALAFRNFRTDLHSATGKDVLVVPGNHDQKLSGNTLFGMGRRLRELTKLEWSSVFVDDDLRCTFYCFDSSRDADNFARGCITRQQMMEVSTEFETKAGSRPVIRDYLSVVLTHHHPYSFRSASETLLQKAIKLAGMDEESFLRMDNADEFLRWCAGRRIPLVLHGHKHVARHVKDQIWWEQGLSREAREVTAVGCGTSLGAEGRPLSYNILEWSPSSRKWTVSFFSDPGLGTGFEEMYVAMHAADA